MKNKMCVFVIMVVVVFVLPLVEIKIKYKAPENTANLVNMDVFKVVEYSYIPSPEKRLTGEILTCSVPEISIEEQIVAIDTDYEQISKTETPKDAAPVRYFITDDERAAIENIVASEGGYCPYEFQALVAECILNGCEAENMRPLEIFERGDFWLTNNVAPDETTKQAVSDVFDKGVMPTAEKVRYYYNPEFCESPMHEQMCYVLTNCGCRFFKDWD